MPPHSSQSTAPRVRLATTAEARAHPAWRTSLAHLAKDHRYYEIVADTLGDAFDCRALLVEDEKGGTVAAQPCFFVEQDLALAAPAPWRACVAAVRRILPRFLRMRLLMAGCAAGEAHPALAHLPALNAALRAEARAAGCAMAVWKDVPHCYRAHFASNADFLRLPSMPATRLPLQFASFDDYLAQRVSHATRKDLRRKFRAAPPLTLEVTPQLGARAEAVHALYAQVLARSTLSFERLTPTFLRELGARMPDRARFFLWSKGDRLVAASICLVHDGVLHDEYLGLDYAVAHDWHLYFLTLRDVLTWAIGQGLREYRSTPLGYGPKLHLGMELAPLDLHLTAPRLSLRGPAGRLLQLFGPLRGEPLLQRFPNAHEL